MSSVKLFIFRKIHTFFMIITLNFVRAAFIIIMKKNGEVRL